MAINTNFQVKNGITVGTGGTILVSSGSNIGINTPNPTEILHVVGNSRVTGARIDSNNSKGTNGQILLSTGSGTSWSTQQSLNFGTYFSGGSYNGSSSITISIAATSANITNNIVVRDVSGNFSAGIITGNSFIPASSTVPTNGLYLPSANTLGLATNSTGRVFIDSSGNVGIGTSSPGAPLDVNGTIILRSSGTQLGAIFNNSSQLEIQANSNSTGLRLGCSASSPVIAYTNGTERLRIDSSGRLLVGTSSSRSVGGIQGSIQLEGTSFATSSMSLMNNATDTNPAFLTFGKSKGGANGSVTSVSSNDYIGLLKFVGADGTSLVEAARIEADVDGTPSTNSMPGRLVFSTTPSGSNNPTERMRITNAGKVGINHSSPNYILDINSTDAIKIPVGTTAQRPTGNSGALRYNNEFNQLEVYDGAWSQVMAQAAAIAFSITLGS